MNSASAYEDAAGATMKAIQCIEAASEGKAVHPRAGDLTYPEFYLSRCTQCRRCTDECPFGALQEDEKGNPVPMPTRCRRCGVCMGACPERIISFQNYQRGHDRFHSQGTGAFRKKTKKNRESSSLPVRTTPTRPSTWPVLKKLKYSPYVRDHSAAGVWDH